MNPELELSLRLVIATVLGGIFGFERESRHKPAGLRTHTLVCLGAAIFTIAGIYGFPVVFGTDSLIRNTDPARIAAQVVTGVGFIGGGIIFKEKDHIAGITTAASIWLTAGLGVAVGSGLYILTLVSALLGLASLEFDRFLVKVESSKHKDKDKDRRFKIRRLHLRKKSCSSETEGS